MKQKLVLKFVNKGKPFEVVNWTVEMHEKAMVKAIEATEKSKMSEIEKENELKYYIILESLQKIDSTVTIDDVKKFFIHPENVVEAFNLVYYAGKQDIYFRKGKKSPSTKKDTSKKN